MQDEVNQEESEQNEVDRMKKDDDGLTEFTATRRRTVVESLFHDCFLHGRVSSHTRGRCADLQDGRLVAFYKHSKLFFIFIRHMGSNDSRQTDIRTYT